ncbi:unnamed protein product [Orchesella dallaii]|uniref:U3 small nucleolar RNA-associated protein 15 homolog n=1 Tax=Orchesella dallaii TaxID=48710 RepID=A0ABP1QAI3_9HEXA
METFKKTYVAPFQKSSVPISPDTLYWKKFTPPILLKEVNLVDFIDVSPIEPHFVAVTCSSRVQLYHPITRMIHKNYNRFKEAAYGAVFRNDGKLLLAGSDECAVKLFEVTSKNLLRVFKGHQRAVHRCAFLPTDNQIVSFSDDKAVIQWDIPTEKIIHKYEGHSDYVRSGTVVDSNPNLIISGSYDQTVKLWDKRAQDNKEMISVNHGSPVESVIMSPSGSLLFTAGLTEIRVWDCLAGGRLLSKISQHHKTITCLRFATNCKRLLSASLDRHVKVYDMSTFEVVHTYDYSSPILSMGITPNDKALIVGMTDGIIAISRKEEESAQDEVSSEQIGQHEESGRRRKGKKLYSDYAITDSGVKEVEYSSGKRYDTYLRKFRYSKALDEVLSDYYYNQHPAATVAVIQELIRRDGLKTALAGRQGRQLIRVLRFLVKHLRRQRFMRVLLLVAHTLCDMYAKEVGQDATVDQLFLRLCEEIDGEVLYMTELLELQGSLEMIVAGGDLVRDNGIHSLSSASAPVIISDSTAKTQQASSTSPTTRLEPSKKAKEAVVVKLKS